MRRRDRPVHGIARDRCEIMSAGVAPADQRPRPADSAAASRPQDAAADFAGVS